MGFLKVKVALRLKRQTLFQNTFSESRVQKLEFNIVVHKVQNQND